METTRSTGAQPKPPSALFAATWQPEKLERILTGPPQFFGWKQPLRPRKLQLGHAGPIRCSGSLAALARTHQPPPAHRKPLTLSAVLQPLHRSAIEQLQGSGGWGRTGLVVRHTCIIIMPTAHFHTRAWLEYRETFYGDRWQCWQKHQLTTALAMLVLNLYWTRTHSSRSSRPTASRRPCNDKRSASSAASLLRLAAPSCSTVASKVAWVTRSFRIETVILQRLTTG